MTKFFENTLEQADGAVFKTIIDENARQQTGVELIASENIVSRAVMQAMGSVMTNKYAEGYPQKRYYGGCEVVDVVEQLAIDRAKQLFKCDFANVQPHSGSQANQGVFNALLQPGDTILGLDLAAGGHLTHGSKVNQSGKWFNAIHYTVDKHTHLIDMAHVRTQAETHKPKMIIAGGSAYSQPWDFAEFRAIADAVGAYLLVDMAHFAGLVATATHDHPFPYAHVVTTTTHKTLRGPRGGLILTNDADIAKKVNSAIFPGIQGGPLMHIIAAKAVAFGEALQPEFTEYSKQVIANAKVLAHTLIVGGLKVVSGGTTNHLVLVDLTPKSVTGKVVDAALGRAGITSNKNGIPFDKQSPFVTSGIRLGTPAGTTRGFKEAEFKLIADLILKVVDGIVENGEDNNAEVENAVHEKVKNLCAKFPLYPELY